MLPITVIDRHAQCSRPYRDKIKGYYGDCFDHLRYLINFELLQLVNGYLAQAYNLSRDHKPDLEVEKERILKAGGFIHAGRVNGSLNLARAIGNCSYCLWKSNAPLLYCLCAWVCVCERASEISCYKHLSFMFQVTWNSSRINFCQPKSKL